MPDGKRKRRHSELKPRRDWYAHYRSLRFRRRFGLNLDIANPAASLT